MSQETMGQVPDQNPDQGPDAIVFQGVSKAFDGGQIRVVDGVSFVVRRYEFLAIVGVSGSGKTTLLRLANRIIEPDSGTVFFNGTDARQLDPIAMRRRMGTVIQGAGLFPHMTVEENVSITPRLLRTPADRQAARFRELMALVHLDPDQYRKRYPRELSGGERQRVAFARALAAHPDIMLMDEPFTALDPLTHNTLADDYRSLHDHLALTTIMITHDMADALLLADRIAVIRSGRLIAVSAPGELAHHADPYVSDLLRAPRRTAGRLQTLLSVAREDR